MTAVVQYTIERIDGPWWGATQARVNPNPWALHDASGEQAEWGWAIPAVYRLLAAPEPRQPFPRKPHNESDNEVSTYWASLLQLLVYSFGWPRPDQGLRWWYDAGHPADDPRLALIDQVWRQDGQ